MIASGSHGLRLRATRAIVSLSAIASNLVAIRKRSGTRHAWAMVKANAYGHGMVPVASFLARNGADGFGVATAEEGLDLRSAGVNLPVLVLGGEYGAEHRAVIEARLTPVVHREDDVAAFSAASPSARLGVHLEVDTGMSRLGLRPEALPKVLERIRSVGNVSIDGLFTHLAAADDPSEDAFTRAQLATFERAVETVRAAGHVPSLHVANSGGIWRFGANLFDAVRPGLSLYGVLPSPAMAELDLSPALALVSRVTTLRVVRAGDTVGYDRTFAATADTRVATIPVGYGDGYLRSTSNRAHVLVRGVRCPVVGRVSMDSLMADVSVLADSCVGDEVVLIGRSSETGASITAHELAGWAGTNAYEVLTAISARVPREYIGGA